jgi:hypothetical protein
MPGPGSKGGRPWTVRSCCSSRAAARRLVGLLTAALLVLAGPAASVWVGVSPTSAASIPVWTQLSPAVSPSGAFLPVMAYDPATSQLVLFGTFSGSGDTSTTTWVWDGTSWARISSTGPPALFGASMAYDPATSQLVLFGGEGGGDSYPGDTWAWDGTSWARISSTGPPGRLVASMAYDPATSQLVLFGGAGIGDNGSSPLGDTWAWDGTTWAQLFPSLSPSARIGASMAYDPATSQLVLFGGDDDDGGSVDYLGDTWAWNGTTWAQLSPAQSPPARVVASMAYDPAISQLVLFGGEDDDDGSIGYLGDTWAWNGTTWAQLPISPAQSPPARGLPSMAYDPATGQLMLFGGISHSVLLDDTWTFGPGANPPRPVITQAQPLSGKVSAAGLKYFRSHLAATGQNGPVRYVTTSRFCGLAVSPGGAITIRGHLTARSCTVSGTDSDSMMPVNAGTWTYTLTVGAVTITQRGPLAATTTTAASAAFRGHFRTNGGRGKVRYVTTSGGCGVIVSPAGAISTRGRLGAGQCTVSGTDTDTTGAEGRWTFTLTVT